MTLLAIDFGTSSTVAVRTMPDGRSVPLLFDASPLLPSAVFATPNGGAPPTGAPLPGGLPTSAPLPGGLPTGAPLPGGLLTGADAIRAAIGHPAGLEPHPKRRVDDGTVWLGDRELPVTGLIAAVLARVADEARRVGGDIDELVLTHPASWGRSRLGVLEAAAATAGLPRPSLLPEPVAAAIYFTAVLGRAIPPGRALLVYDLGAGTCDLSVVRADLTVVAYSGLPDVGGLDLDEVVVRHARDRTGGAEHAWQRLDRPDTAADRAVRLGFRQDARAVKEHLSRHPAGDLYVPIADATVTLTRDEFEAGARPYLERTARLAERLRRDADVELGAVFLVGGAVRSPLVADVLRAALRTGQITSGRPELAVAEGAAHRAAEGTARRVAAEAPPPVAEAPPPVAAVPARSRRILLSAAAMLLAGAAAVPALLPDRPVAPPPPSFFTSGLVNDIAIGPDGTLVAVAGKDGHVRLWDARTRTPAGPVLISGAGKEADAVAFSPDGTILASGGEDRLVRLWDVAGRRPLGEPLAGHTGSVLSLRFSPDGTTLASGGGDETLRLWDVATRRALATIDAADPSDGTGDTVGAIAFSPDGGTVVTAAGGFSGTVQIWDIGRRELSRPVLTGSRGSPVLGITLSPDGRILAAGTSDGAVRLWDMATREPLGKPRTRDGAAPGRASADRPWDVVFSPDGTLLAASGTAVRLWDAAGRPLAGEVTRYPEPALNLAFGPDGSTLVVSYHDGTVRFWPVAPGALTPTAQPSATG